LRFAVAIATIVLGCSTGDFGMQHHELFFVDKTVAIRIDLGKADP
jgi:hypothetical protein